MILSICSRLEKSFSYSISYSYSNLKSPIFLGHSGPVRSVYVQDSEHCFLSASKDKTVKLWSLSNHGDGTAQSASSWTYYRHTRQVFHVAMVESVRHAVSCDGSLHVSFHFVSSIPKSVFFYIFLRIFDKNY